MLTASLGEALLASAERHNARPALWAGGGRHTYAELFGRAGRMAAELVEAGVSAGERVAILARRDVNAYSGILGALIAGCTYVPLNTRFPRQRNQSILKASGAAAVIADDHAVENWAEYLDPLSDGTMIVRSGAHEALSAGAWDRGYRAADMDQPAYLLFTSGTTGEPKGVPISHANVAAYLNGVSQVGGYDAEDRALQLVDLTFDLSVHDMFLTWLNGAELYVVPENASLLAPRLIRQHEITVCLMVPSAAAGTIEQKQAQPGSMPSLRLSYFCGEALPRSVADGWSKAAPQSRVINIYGPTEATVAFSFYEFKQGEPLQHSVLPIGQPFHGQSMGLFDPELQPVALGDEGQICLAGSQLTSGYWRAPHLNAEKFFTRDGVRWYLTGDLGRVDPSLGYIFTGRADRQVKIRGYRAELQEIEGVVRRATGRQQVAVIAWPLRSPGVADGSVAFICGEPTETADIRATCRVMVADYLVPDRIIFLSELPLNPNGKVDYKQLAQHPALING